MDKNKYPLLSSAAIGSTITRPFLVTEIEQETAKNNKPFVKITLMDGFSSETAVKFDTSAEDLQRAGVAKNTVADAELSVGEFNGGRNFKIVNIRPTADKEASPLDFIRRPPVDPDVMYDEICALLSDCAVNYTDGSTPLSELALSILNDNKTKFMNSSASVTMHHNLRGGLLYHTYRMIKSANALCGIYTSLDRELLLCGVALHDIGKIWEYETSFFGDAEFTSSGIMFGHMYLGASLIKKYTSGKKYNSEKVKLLIHLILSHHGTREWGAVVTPAIPEAFMLHYVDNIDAKLYVCEEKYDILGSGTMTDKKPFGLENRIYKPKLPEVITEAELLADDASDEENT